MAKKSKKMHKMDMVKCGGCGKDILIRHECVRRALKKYGHDIDHFCPDCASKHRSEMVKSQWKNMSPETRSSRGNKISKARKEYHASLSPEDKLAYSQVRVRQWENMPEKQKQAKVQALVNGSKRYQDSLSPEEKDANTAKRIAGFKKWYPSLSEEDKEARRNHQSKVMKDRWESLSPEEREFYRIAVIEWNNSLTEEEKQQISEMKKAQRANMSPELKEYLSRSHAETTKQMWDSMTEEERKERDMSISIGLKEYWKNADEEAHEFRSKLTKEFWESLPEEEQQRRISLASKWYDDLSEEERLEHRQFMREVNITYWNSLSPEEKFEISRKKFMHSSNRNKFNIKFETAFDQSKIGSEFYYVPELQLMNGDYRHYWDYGIFDQSCELVAVVDLDGEFYHGDSCDYNGNQSKLESDENRILSLKSDVKCYIIPERNFQSALTYLTETLTLSMNRYYNRFFQRLRSQPFPYQKYQLPELLKSYQQLQSMNCIHQKPSLNTRLGDRLIYHFHRNIWHCSVGNSPSPYDVWYDDKLLRKCIEDHTIYQNHLNPNKILQGFNVSSIAPKVSVFSAGRAKLIIHRYLSEYDTVFDPFSGFSGILLGTISLGKKYIGRDINEINVREANNLIKFLQDCYKFDATVNQQDVLTSSGSYPCLFTCPPYGDKEQWNGTPVDKRSCDDWIDICLERFKCKRYVFVVGETNKFQRYIIDEIRDVPNMQYIIMI